LQGSIFFATTIVTTIGYGAFSPVTDGGKFWLVVLAIPLIGMFGYCLSEVMGVFMEALSVACIWIRDVILCKNRMHLMVTLEGLVDILRRCDTDRNDIFSQKVSGLQVQQVCLVYYTYC
jgi:hypothetical protein